MNPKKTRVLAHVWTHGEFDRITLCYHIVFQQNHGSTAFCLTHFTYFEEFLFFFVKVFVLVHVSCNLYESPIHTFVFFFSSS